MNTRDDDEMYASYEKEARRKKGLNYLLAAVIFLIISFVMYSLGIEGGILFGIVSLVMVIFFIGGLVFLIWSFVGKG